MIEVNARKRLGGFLLDAGIRDSGFICLAGPNGSGKSTLLNIIAGVLTPDEGSVLVNSRDVTKFPIEKRGVVLVSPDSSIPQLEVNAHLAWGAKARGIGVDRAYIDRVRKALGISFEGRVRQLSLGMRERVVLATALISRPKAILVDEAFSSLDNREEYIQNYRALSTEAEIDVIFASQSAEKDAEHAEHLYRMEIGRSTRLF